MSLNSVAPHRSMDSGMLADPLVHVLTHPIALSHTHRYRITTTLSLRVSRLAPAWNEPQDASIFLVRQYAGPHGVAVVGSMSSN